MAVRDPSHREPFRAMLHRIKSGGAERNLTMATRDGMGPEEIAAAEAEQTEAESVGEAAASTPALGTCNTPHKLSCMPNKEHPWVQFLHEKTDSCSHWKFEPADSGAPPRPICTSCGWTHPASDPHKECKCGNMVAMGKTICGQCAERDYHLDARCVLHFPVKSGEEKRRFLGAIVRKRKNGPKLWSHVWPKCHALSSWLCKDWSVYVKFSPTRGGA